uniref:C2H2-type domain-containing protein n=1 Tax=Pelusios castaneus TaxID=367368 RepID=A0A8C8RI13_9SAUR
MDTKPEVKKEKTQQQTPFYCNICKISCASALNLQTHFLGFKHKTVEEALKTHGIVKTVSGVVDEVKAPVKLPFYVQTEPDKWLGKSLEEQLNACKDSEPALGLEYIIEYRLKENLSFFYECELCNCQSGLTNMFMHVYGTKHRLAYLKQHYPEIAESVEVKGRGSEQKRRVKQIAARIEKKEGRKKIQVKTDPPVKKRKSEIDFCPAKAKVQCLDASTSNEGKASDADKDKQISDSTQTLSSQDGKDTQDEQEKSQKEQPKTTENIDTNKADENSKGDKTGCDDGNQSKDEKGKKEVQDKKKDEIFSEDFTSHEELLAYLQSFEILNEDDAAFILKITQSLTNALVGYRLQLASAKDSLDSEPNREGTVEHLTEQSDVTSVDISDSNTDKQHPPQQPYDETAGKSNVSGTFTKKDSLTVNLGKSNATDWKSGTSKSTFRELSNELSVDSASAAEEQYPFSSQETVSNEKCSSATERDAPQNSLTNSLGTSYENDVTTEFFNSVRNMGVAEVTATLQKIVATNPAFRGIDIPNVIKMLTESGTLRAPNSDSMQ